MEEALGIDEEKGVLSDILDQIDEEALTESLEDVVEMEPETALDQEPTRATIRSGTGARAT